MKKNYLSITLGEKLRILEMHNKESKLIKEQTQINPNNLKFGDRDNPNDVDGPVHQLQKKLIDLKLLNIKNPTGYFGKLTKRALDSYEQKNTTPNKNNNTKKQTYILFDGNFLSWVEDGNVIKKWKGYSGRTKWNTFGDKNLIDMVNKYGQDYTQFMKIGNAGPIPEGNYTISQIQKRTNGNARSLLQGKTYKELLPLMMTSKDRHNWNTGSDGDLIAWGDYRCPISPIKGTNTFGRGSFYIHGGGIAGSIGCIDLLLEMDDFASFFQNWKTKTGKNILKLVVKY